MSADRCAPYEKLAETLREAIRNGSYTVGDKLPPVRELARTHQVSPGTAQRAVTVLRDEGVVESQTGQGSRVVSEPRCDALGDLSRRVDQLEQRIDEIAQRCSRE